MLKTNAVFGDGMILQRSSTVAVFGETDCDFVEVEWCSEIYTARIVQNRWIAKIKTGDAGENLSMRIKGKKNTGCEEILEYSDILLGEVWLDGGQSNMELEIQNSLGGKEAIESADFDRIRYYKVPKYPVVDEGLLECEKYTSWKALKDGQFADMSAVAFHFATKLYEKLGVPVGMIDCYQGGTSATCWVSEEALKAVTEVTGYIKEWEDEINSKSDEQYAKEMDDYNASLERWQKTVDELKAQNPNIEMVDINQIAGPYPWPLPRGKASAFRPCGLHNSMILRVAPYTVKGFLYYQAEEDCDRADYYCKLNSAVIKQWRADWNVSNFFAEMVDYKEDDNKLPFFLMQLPMFIGADAEDDKKWCVLREQQYLCSQINDNVGITVIADCGEFDNIHPLDKKTPGHRLAGRVLADVYGCRCSLHNLIFKDIQFGNRCEKSVNEAVGGQAVDEAECRLSFEGTDGKLFYRESDGKQLTALKENIPLENGNVPEGQILGFEISNNGRDFYKPDISVEDDQLILKGHENMPITDARYGWFNYGVVNVYNSDGMPLMPFWKKCK